eukprot:GHVO01011120.1.p1 GENE.GHVO01011120.1~~GHVO01011120.1.p1  ORF type:complete len:203 (+),score=23.10 GHVO01011120.1:202-810(+)
MHGGAGQRSEGGEVIRPIAIPMVLPMGMSPTPTSSYLGGDPGHRCLCESIECSFPDKYKGSAYAGELGALWTALKDLKPQLFGYKVVICCDNAALVKDIGNAHHEEGQRKGPCPAELEHRQMAYSTHTSMWVEPPMLGIGTCMHMKIGTCIHMIIGTCMHMIIGTCPVGVVSDPMGDTRGAYKHINIICMFVWDIQTILSKQ